jgi:hypothetical protein
MGAVAGPVAAGEADLGIGSRVRGHAEPGALSPQQRVGNRVATLAMRPLYGVTITDLGPYRCMRRQALLDLGMRERNLRLAGRDDRPGGAVRSSDRRGAGHLPAAGLGGVEGQRQPAGVGQDRLPYLGRDLGRPARAEPAA